MSLTSPPAPVPRITYGAVLGSPYVARLLGGTLASRLPNGVGGLVYGRRTRPGAATRGLIVSTAALLGGWLPLLALRFPVRS
ncbi:hypothetical protein ACFZAT_08510 [Streptomyces sp. NPDC008163]|uniref:hypothetical protein n=1 Tax=Streptomyces sp. NPDC008163 TaxID=3364818 RepID=UPI0036E49041